ncbi:MAG: hypothetical protein O2890_06050 [Cyanobacteria bacterium]|nr:hypothetical protein [Cyanobacteriota bacterium]MDA0865969.1 hypothetical protein [Cyanobacteriota bacterium]
MRLTPWLLTSLIAGTLISTLTPQSPFTLAAQAQAEATDDRPAGTPPPLPEGFKTYALPGSFSIQVPEAWVAVGSEAEQYAVITNFEADLDRIPQPSDIKTEVWFTAETADTAVNNSIQAIINNGYAVNRYRQVDVNQLRALRLWLVDLPLDYPNQVVTYIGYGTYGTAILVTHYQTRDDETTALIEQVHDSFGLLFQ